MASSPSNASILPATSFRGAFFLGVCIAFVGGTFLGLAEALLNACLVGPSIFQALDCPWPIIFAAFARHVVIHAAFWTLLGMACSIPLAWWIARRGFNKPVLPPECVHLPLFVLLAGAVVITSGLDAIARISTGRLLAAGAATFSLSLVLFVGLRRLSARGWSRRLRWASARAALLCLPVVLVAVCLVARSPFRGAEAFRLPQGPSPMPARPPPPPNILWIVMDAVRADRLSCYGHDHPTTPFLDRLTSESLVYERVVANSFWTVPTHASMFTGLPVRGHGCYHGEEWLDESHLTIAEALKDRGYITAAFSNNINIGRSSNFSQGFDSFVEVFALSRLGKNTLRQYLVWLGLAPPAAWMEMDDGAAVTNLLVARFLQRLAQEPRRPFFAFINYMETHSPYSAPAAFRRAFMNDAEVNRSYALRRRAYGDLNTVLQWRYNFSADPMLDDGDLLILRKLYDASLGYLDWRLRELLEHFQRRGLLENTIAVVSSDHGELLGEHQRWGHHYGLYEGLVHVPLIVRYPLGRPRGRLRHTVQASDLFATTASWAGVDLPPIPGLQSHILPLKPSSDFAPRLAVAECTCPRAALIRWAEQNIPSFDRDQWTHPLRAVVEGRYKYLRSTDGRRALYDVQVDPREMNNLIEARPILANQLNRKLLSWVAATLPYQRPGDQAKPERSRLVVRQMESLGYLQETSLP